MADLDTAAGDRFRAFRVKTWATVKRVGRTAWEHHTHTIVGMGAIAGGVQNFLANHKDMVLPQWAHGMILMSCGGLVAVVEIYKAVRAATSDA
jgi:hypothetical protein